MDDRTSNIDLSEAQGILQQLAAAFPLVNTVTVPSLLKSAVHEIDWPLPESEARYQTLDRTNSRRRVHGVSRQRNRRSLRQPAD